MSLRPWLYGGLGAFVVGAWATLDTRGPQPAVPAVPAAPFAIPSQGPASELSQRAVLETAAKDPFAIAPAPIPAAVVLANPMPAPPPVQPSPPPEPVAPPLNLRFTGRMVGPDGRVAIFAMAGNEQVTLTPGLLLPGGYRVDRITDTVVELTYPPLNTSARLDLPPAPTHEIR